MFKLFLISIVLMPLLIGVHAAKDRKGDRDRAALRIGWLVYCVLWFGTLYYLKRRWA